jgi:hypothetical protein
MNRRWIIIGGILALAAFAIWLNLPDGRNIHLGLPSEAGVIHFSYVTMTEGKPTRVFLMNMDNSDDEVTPLWGFKELHGSGAVSGQALGLKKTTSQGQ